MASLKDILEKCKSDLVCISCPWWFDKAIVRTGEEWLSYFGNKTVNCYDVKYYCDDCEPADWQHYICIN